jgi:hypothetical protein
LVGDVAVKISYVCHTGLSVASTRYRIVIPANGLNKLGHHVTVGPPDLDADVVVFSKHFSQDDPDLARRARGRVAFDICDDHFDTKFRDHYTTMIDLASTITCSTETLRSRIAERTGREANVIPDPYEFPEQEPSFSPGNVPRLLWFGHVINVGTLRPLMPRLEHCKLTIITNGDLSAPRAGVEVVKWSPQSMLVGFRHCDMVIIPSNLEEHRTRVKSTNRIVESIRQGKFVSASKLPSYEQFSPWMHIGDVIEGVEWALSNPSEIVGRVKDAQGYVKTKFSPKIIANLWEEALSA